MSEYSFVKGHGTENDFVLVPDANGRHELTAEQVARLCDRRAGIGGDGVIRVVRTDATEDPAAVAARGEATLVHGLPQLRRLAQRDVRQRHPRARPLPGHPRRRRPARPAADRDPRRHQDAHLRRRPDHRRHGPARGARRDHGHRRGAVSFEAAPRQHGQPARRRVRRRPRRRPARCARRPATTRRSTPTASTSSSSYAAASTTSRCGCTSAARARPGPAAPARAPWWWRRPLADGAERGTPYTVDLPGGTLQIVWTEDDRILMTGRPCSPPRASPTSDQPRRHPIRVVRPRLARLV